MKWRCGPSSGAAGASSGRTNLLGADLSPDVLSWAARIEDLGGTRSGSTGSAGSSWSV